MVIFVRIPADPQIESGAIDLTKAERIAEGGTHVLYRFPDAPFVIKLGIARRWDKIKYKNAFSRMKTC